MEGKKTAKEIKFILRSSWRISRNFKGPGEDGAKEEENSVEEEGSYGTEGAPAPSEPSLLAIMRQMTQIKANLQAASSSE
ncbi:hypothetical protein O181_037405 [Austropuccinia psidii MF-1]|uniref:Uncharacterized protein n=1 Tax=Austropuccinia psidii MF-1 TaxID=1389203 RepID=A0A9Q3DAV0_9BASI|nr:hypothetical protein [Austropuccinia psidii MF-1]